MKKYDSGNRARNLTEGAPARLILGFAIPLLFGLLFQQLYNMVDSIIVGRILGVDGLAAVGSTGSINFMIVGFCIGAANGFAIPVAQNFGAQRYSEMRRYVAGSAWLCGISGIVISSIVCLFCRQILVWMRTPENILQNAWNYIIIIFAGIPIVFLYNMTAAILRSLGDSRTPVIFLVASSVMNIGLDLVMVRPFGVAGAAVATLIAQLFSGLGCLCFLCSHFPVLRFEKEEWRLQKKYAGKLLINGIPMGLQYSFTAVGSVILQTSVNSLGSMAVASITAAGKTYCFIACPFEALGSTIATFTGQNAGAGKLDRVKDGVRSAAAMGTAYSLLSLVLVLVFGKYLALLFVDASQIQLIHNFQECLNWDAFFFVLLTMVDVFRYAIQGLGYGTVAIFSGICEMIARTVGGLFFVPVLGFTGACISNPFAWLCATIFLIPAFIIVMKRMEKHLNSEAVI